MKKGEKYIIEISEIHTSHDENGKSFPLARIKGFSTLVFDEKGLSRLEKYVEPQEEPKETFLNCWFVVTKIGTNYGSTKCVKVGNKYHVIDGFFVASQSTVFPLVGRLKTREQLIDYMLNDFACVEIAILEGYDDAST